MSDLYNISLNQPNLQSKFPFFSIRLNKELLDKITKNKDNLSLKTSESNNVCIKF